MELSTTDAPDSVITTITQSKGGSDTEVIPKNYLMTSKSLLRLKEKFNDPQWKKQQECVPKMIDIVLKEKMIIKVQRLQVTYTKQDKEYVVGNFQEIGRAWKQLLFNCNKQGTPKSSI